MARKLLRFTTILSVPALGFGVWLWWGYGIGRLGAGNGWMHAKLLVIGATLAYHVACARILQSIAGGHSQRSHMWYRWFNEIPVGLLLVAVVLVVVKPF
jgi:putative membrane protein